MVNIHKALTYHIYKWPRDRCCYILGTSLFLKIGKLGYVSSRHKTQGSIFIQELCKELMEQFYVLDVSTMASNVNKRIMKRYEQIQAPVFENQLGDLVFFDAGNLKR